MNESIARAHSTHGNPGRAAIMLHKVQIITEHSLAALNEAGKELQRFVAWIFSDLICIHPKFGFVF